MPEVTGNLAGLKKSQVYALERVFRRHVPPDEVISVELMNHVAKISREIGRQVGLVIERDGNIAHVLVGDDQGVMIPDLGRFGLGRGKLRGLRLVHTHLRGEGLTSDDIADLTLLRLDALCAVTVDEEGAPKTLHFAHLLPPNPEGETYRELTPVSFYGFGMNFGEFIKSLSDEIVQKQERSTAIKAGGEKAIIVHVSKLSRQEIDENLDELAELCKTAGISVIDRVVQRPREGRSRYLMGEGKIREVAANALQNGVDLLVFDQELQPSQVRDIAELVELRVIDRTQLILDVFARRAHTPDGKVQVELAQLRYVLPRLAGKGVAMSRLMGGVGGRGPGESKLEMDRRKVKDRIAKLEDRLKELSRGRMERRKRRTRNDVPIVSIVGYTNAGKSTLLNALTSSDVFTENLLFATLDTSTRRLRFPTEREVIITDTVGFIRDLPMGLVGAFKATLEELSDATLLLHVVDVSNPTFEKQIKAVEKLLKELELDDKPVLMVFNKCDLVSQHFAEQVLKRFGGVSVSAKNPKSFAPLMNEMERRFWPSQPSSDEGPGEQDDQQV